MSTQQNGGQAFPVAGSEHNYPIEGMTLLDYFAAKALQGFIANKDRPMTFHPDDDAAYAYAIAAAMLRAREAS